MVLTTTAILVLIGAQAAAQSRARPSVSEQRLNFYLETYNLPSNMPGKSQLHIVADVKHADLQFILAENRYTGKIQASITIRQEDQASEVRDLSREVEVAEFSQTLDAEAFIRFHELFELVPGAYSIGMTITDQHAQNSGTINIPVTLKDFQQPGVYLSSIMFLPPEHPRSLSPGRVLPLFSSHFPDSTIAVFSLVSNSEKDKIKLAYEMFNAEGDRIYRNSYTSALHGHAGWIRLALRHEQMQVGVNTLTISAQVGKDSDIVRKRFFAQQEVALLSGADLRHHIEQLAYIADKNELKQILAAPDSLQKSWFDAFWRQRDPTPNTAKNELQEEYYLRVAYAIRQFREGKTSGWQTDRGEIYIKYGPPDRLERRNARENLFTRYEIWYYDKLNRQFIFRNSGGTQFWRTS